MTRSMSARELVIEVELAVLAGRNLDQIEAEILGSSGLDEQARSAVWLYAWGNGERLSRPQPSLPAG
jgi:hypothetical protein